MYYPCSENKGADQLRSNCEADLRLCFRLGKNPVFTRCGSSLNDNNRTEKKHAADGRNKDLERDTPKPNLEQGFFTTEKAELYSAVQTCTFCLVGYYSTRMKISHDSHLNFGPNIGTFLRVRNKILG